MAKQKTPATGANPQSKPSAVSAEAVTTEAVAIGARIGCRDDRRHEVRHDDGAGEVAAGVADHAFQHGAVAQVQVPVVRPADGEFSGHRRLSRVLRLR